MQSYVDIDFEILNEYIAKEKENYLVRYQTKLY